MRLLLTLVCSTGMVASAGYVSGATITVTTTEPGISADGLCSFAEAVDNVNGGDVHSDCEAGSDGLNIIELGQGETYLQRQGDYYYPFGELTLINGNGSTFDAMDEEAGWRRLEFGDGIINDLTIKGSSDDYGAIQVVSGRLSLNRCIIKDNHIGVGGLDSTILTTDTVFVSNRIGIKHWILGDSTLIAINTDFVSNGSAIAHEWLGGAPPTATLIGCTVEDNELGIWAFSVEIRHSTIINNDLGVLAKSGSIRNTTVAGNGRGVFLGDFPGSGYGSGPYQFIFMSSTISGNTEYGLRTEVGGPMVGTTWPGTAYIRDSTITGNTRGLYGSDSQYIIKNSIIGSNQTNCINGPGGSGSPQSQGFNLTDDNSCNLNHSTDMVVSDMMLSELGDWGGSTQTHMPLEGSPAIDMVKWASQCSSRDQRGYLRPVDGDGNGVAHCDCGAVEYGAEPPPRPLDPGVTTSEVE